MVAVREIHQLERLQLVDFPAGLPREEIQDLGRLAMGKGTGHGEF
jgi:hypothetical protein